MSLSQWPYDSQEQIPGDIKDHLMEGESMSDDNVLSQVAALPLNKRGDSPFPYERSDRPLINPHGKFGGRGRERQHVATGKYIHRSISHSDRRSWKLWVYNFGVPSADIMHTRAPVRWKD